MLPGTALADGTVPVPGYGSSSRQPDESVERLQRLAARQEGQGALRGCSLTGSPASEGRARFSVQVCCASLAAAVEAEGTESPREADRCSPPARIYCRLLLSLMMVSKSSPMPGYSGSI